MFWGKRPRTFNSLPMSRYFEMTLGSLHATNDLRQVSRAEIDETSLAYYHKLTRLTQFPCERERVLSIVPEAIANNDFVCILYKDEKCVGGIVATISRTTLCSREALMQTSYNCTLDGSIAISAIKLLHRMMLEFCRRSGIYYAISTCGPFDTKQILCRVLEKDGWTREGHQAFYIIEDKNGNL